MLAALAVAGGVLALVYVFVGPTSAILPSLFTAVMAAAVIWLLYGRSPLGSTSPRSAAQRKYVSLSHSQLSRRFTRSGRRLAGLGARDVGLEQPLLEQRRGLGASGDAS